ncbi:hypothetical protein [Paenibacillus sp. MMS18-CY102]|nr:hypothetical protein [Paenibacillus sp. MMS18-CY102]
MWEVEVAVEVAGESEIVVSVVGWTNLTDRGAVIKLKNDSLLF